jgi:hypothetical protein
MVGVFVKWILGTILDRVKAQITKLVFTTITALRSDSKECTYVAIDLFTSFQKLLKICLYFHIYLFTISFGYEK